MVIGKYTSLHKRRMLDDVVMYDTETPHKDRHPRSKGTFKTQGHRTKRRLSHPNTSRIRHPRCDKLHLSSFLCINLPIGIESYLPIYIMNI